MQHFLLAFELTFRGFDTFLLLLHKPQRIGLLLLLTLGLQSGHFVYLLAILLHFPRFSLIRCLLVGQLNLNVADSVGAQFVERDDCIPVFRKTLSAAEFSL